MRYFTSALLILTTSLWLGGLVALAMLVMAVFISSGLDRQTAGKATSVMFVWFGKAQLVVAALALIATFSAYLQRRSGAVVTVFILLAIATVGAVAFNTVFVPRLETLRLAGQSQSIDFQSLHKNSERLMTAVIAVVFLAAILIPALIRQLYTIRPSSESTAA